MTVVQENKLETYETLVDGVYATWQELKCSKGEILGLCSAQEKAAMMICWFDSEVKNGGLMQWIDNDYAEWATELTDTMIKVGSGLAEKIAERVNDALQRIEEIKAEWEEDDAEYGYELAYRIADRFDDWYYEVCDDFLAQANNFLETNF